VAETYSSPSWSRISPIPAAKPKNTLIKQDVQLLLLSFAVNVAICTTGTQHGNTNQTSQWHTKEWLLAPVTLHVAGVSLTTLKLIKLLL